jgi:acyl carrier protein
MSMTDAIDDDIRQVLAEHGRLPGDVGGLSDDADLYQAGMSSHASVNVMLTRDVFASIAAIRAAVTSLRTAP